ncbi:MAG TPA: bifunctional phosphopantothenoylcysteine decarboxylase/phosphopantothenate--cysteine ligase CoaBC, partial [Acidimicrobiales bacterium]|nr:bifunctional phosphopantothenoylcysteine decarboxylase/phosphopantothenate--cysteine ligase CoaBC [Acidimicrobiales bacterium]
FPEDLAPLRGRRVVLGVSGGIAAYKAVEVARRLVDAGAVVAPVLTPAGARFIGPATLSAVATEAVRSSLWDEAEPIPHTALGQGADLVLVAPATADLLGRYTAGLADDLLTATLLATRAPVLLAPAMHAEMWEHAATQENLEVLRRRGAAVVGPGEGHLAGGDEGPGRLAEPAEIVAAAAALLGGRGGRGSGDLAGRRVLVSAGGTREPLDPVRFLGNRSSGKQGHALAAAAAARGASVVLVTTTDRPTGAGIEVVAVETAAEMEEAVLAAAPEAAVVVLAAAVADFRPKGPAAAKIRRAEGVPEVVLEPVPDISAAVGAGRRPGQVLVGFAAEVGGDRDALVAKAREKLAEKSLDLIVANDVGAPGTGFAHDTNAVTIVGADGEVRDVPLADKAQVAGAVLDAAVSRLAR